MSAHAVTLRNAILEARAALTSNADLTALVPVAQITYGNSPQKDVMPRIVIEASGTEYDATFMASRKVQTFTLEYAVYSDSVDVCTNIMDKMRDALDIYDSSEFSIRVTDESFQAEVDGTLLGVVVATFQDADGAPGFGAGLSALNDLGAAQADLTAWEASAGMTLQEYQALPTPEIYYQRPQHKHEWETHLGPTNYPLGYQAKHAAGDLNPLQPASISHVAEIDYTTDIRGKTLTHNNEFGNKHRFTYDDGTEATEIRSNNRAYVQGGHSAVGPGGDGYIGSNPQYIIDHLTGLGWHRTYNSSSVAAANNEWWEAATPRTALAGATSFHSYYEAADALTLDGYSDWRVATLQEFLMGYGGPTDNSNTMLGLANNDRDFYFPPVNATLRDTGTRILCLGPIDYNTAEVDDNDPSTHFIAWPLWQSNGAATNLYTDANMLQFFTGTRNDLGMFPLVRKHY